MKVRLRLQGRKLLGKGLKAARTPAGGGPVVHPSLRRRVLRRVPKQVFIRERRCLDTEGGTGTSGKRGARR